ncbi:MAG: 50S ribosomal protein L20 [Chitinophagales bacterium]|nr:50S ribosomal protein L20 [Chitinophagales bacterium]
MPRSVPAVAARKKRKKILKQAKGYWGRKKNVFTVAKNQVEKSGVYAFRDRRNKKRTFRSLWITRINAALDAEGLSYSKFMGNLHKANITINRKVLADLAMNQPDTFKSLIAQVK